MWYQYFFNQVYSIYFCGHYFTKSNFASLYFYHKGLILPAMEFPDGSDYKESASNAGDPGLIPGLGRFLEKEMATHSSILPWRILWTKELVQSMGLQRVRWDCKKSDIHDKWLTYTCTPLVILTNQLDLCSSWETTRECDHWCPVFNGGAKRGLNVFSNLKWAGWVSTPLLLDGAVGLLAHMQQFSRRANW